MLGIVAFAVTIFLAVPAQSAYAFAMAPSPITATPGPNSGQVTLSWGQVGPIQRYALVFGHSSGNFNMGLLSFPTDMRSLTVNHLVPGKTYFFQVWAYDDPNGAATASTEVSAAAK